MAGSKQQADTGQPFSEKLFSFAEDLSKRAVKIFWPSGEKDARDAPLMLIHPVVSSSFSGSVKPDIKNMEEYLAQPLRVREKVTFQDLESFIAYVKRHSMPGESVIFLDVTKPSVTAVIDYHSAENEPSWCTHVVTYAFPTTKEWDEWNSINGKAQDQTKMGLFLEDHLDQIVEPDPGKLLESIMSLKEARKLTLGRAANLQNGMTQFHYVEEGEGAGSFQLPQVITLGIVPYRDGEKYKLEARLRYRWDNNNGALALWFDLVRPQDVIDSAIADVRSQVVEETSLPLFAGIRG